MAGGALAFHLIAISTVQVAVNVGPLKELAPLDHLLERGAVDKKIFATVFFSGSGRAGGERNRIAEVGNGLQNAIDQRTFAAAGGRANDDEHSAIHLVSTVIF